MIPGVGYRRMINQFWRAAPRIGAHLRNLRFPLLVLKSPGLADIQMNLFGWMSLRMKAPAHRTP